MTRIFTCPIKNFCLNNATGCSLSLEPSAASLSLQQVTATDADAGEFGRLTYRLTGDGVEGSEDESAFAIDPLTGAIRLLRVSKYTCL